MSSAPFPLQEILRRLVLRLILMVESALSARVAGLRGRLAGMGAGHRHRVRLERELARAERYAAVVADPAFWAEPGVAGRAAEVARVVNDAGRLALVRRMIWPRRVRRPRAFALVAGPCDWGGRCTGGVGDGWLYGSGLPPSPNPLPPVGGEGFDWGLEGSGGGGLPAAISCVRRGERGGRLVRRGVVHDDMGMEETAR